MCYICHHKFGYLSHIIPEMQFIYCSILTQSQSLQVDGPLLILHLLLQDPLVQGGVPDNNNTSLLLAATEREFEHFSGNTKANISVRVSPVEGQTITFLFQKLQCMRQVVSRTLILHHVLLHSYLVYKQK